MKSDSMLNRVLRRAAVLSGAAVVLVACTSGPASGYRYVDITGKNRGDAELKTATGECQAHRTKVFQDEAARFMAGPSPATLSSVSFGIAAPQAASETADRAMERCFLKHGWDHRPVQ